MPEEHVLEGLGGQPATASAAAEFSGYLLSIVSRTVDGDDIRRRAVVLEGDAVGVGNVGSAEGWVFVGKHFADFAASFRAGVIGAEDASGSPGGELSNGSAEFAVKYLGVVSAGSGVVVGGRRSGPCVG